jgi:hypothetical protein
MGKMGKKVKFVRCAQKLRDNLGIMTKKLKNSKTPVDIFFWM